MFIANPENDADHIISIHISGQKPMAAIIQKNLLKIGY